MSVITSNIVNTSILLRVFLNTATVGRTVATTTAINTASSYANIPVIYAATVVPVGMRFYVIENEIMCGYFDFTTNELAFIGTANRGLFGTGQLEHASGSVIRLASLSEIAAGRIFATRADSNYLNVEPAIVINRMGGVRGNDNPKVVDRFSMISYGGNNSVSKKETDLADATFAALQDRAAEADNSETNFGKLINIELESGQPLISDATRPEWPNVLCFGNINAV